MTTHSVYRRLLGQVRHTVVGGPPSDQDHNIFTWYLSTALLGVVDGGLWVFLPVFLTRLGASPTLIGLYTSLPALLGIVLLIPMGVLVDRVTDQMGMLVRVGVVHRIISLLLVLSPLFIPMHLLPYCLVALWTLLTVPDSYTVPLWTALVSRTVSPERRAHVNGTRWALLSGVSAACQSVFGRWLDAGPFPGIYQVVFSIAYLAQWGELLTFSRLRIAPLPPRERPAAAHWRERIRGYLQPLTQHKPFVRYLAATILYRIALTMPWSLHALLWVRELNASDSLIGLRGTVGYLALVCGYLYWGRAARRMGHRRVLWTSALGTAVYVILSSCVPSAPWIVPVAAIWGATVSGIDVGIFDLMLDACPQGQVTRFASVAQCAANLAIFAGPLLGVSLSEVTSVRTAMLVAGCLQIVATLPFLLLPSDV